MRQRFVFYIALVALLPLVGVAYWYHFEKSGWESVKDELFATHFLAEQKARSQAVNLTVRAQYLEADPLYIDNTLEQLSLLGKEKEALKALMDSPSFTGNEAAEKRYAFITGGANRLHFREGLIQSADGIQETPESLTHPVELDTGDLQNVLRAVEEQREGQPQLLITDLILHKKTQPSGNEVFECTLHLLKREFS